MFSENGNHNSGPRSDYEELHGSPYFLLIVSASESLPPVRAQNVVMSDRRTRSWPVSRHCRTLCRRKLRGTRGRTAGNQPERKVLASGMYFAEVFMALK